MTKTHLPAITLARLAASMSEAFSGPAMSGSMFGGAGVPLFDDADPTPHVMAELKRIETGLKSHLDTQIKEIKANGETSKETREEITKLEKKYDDQVQKVHDLEVKLGRLDMGGASRHEVKTAGQRFTDSDEFKAFAERKSGEARFEVKALTSDAGSVGTLIQPQRLTEIIRPQVRADHVRDIIRVGNTTSNAIEYPRETLFTNNAAPVAEGQLKPESNLKFDTMTVGVKTIAHWVPISKQARDDIPMLTSYVDGRLVEGLHIVEDRELLYGDGTGEHLLGLIPQASAYNRRKSGDTAIDTLRRARTQVRLAEYQADGIVLNPADWEDIELEKGSDGRYIWVSVVVGGEQRLWKMPVIETTAITENDFLVGAFGMAAQIFLREDATVAISEHDRDNFVRNMLTLRAEERLALAVFRPQSFVHGEFVTTP
ncbi:putative phage phi-C31 gp36 major capsid-like protein [Deinococcus phoenicis]|uniref:Putative phage phi-C31 gp36 major capsid-like protein n=1 Tax=Deinococcus phoenicis TaxID=1476583 RepID=A0A016QMV8_9DEIO|nr:phage major capsid protein [Deinococcus phoenicis]EYB67408.1 putative phage phi-C31 gp36 major capsid-like protein [Deinococcus phoenicis]